MRPAQGFTLAELLIALAILGVVSTFAIPKILSAQQDTQFKAKAKEIAGMITQAYDAYRLEQGVVPATMVPADLMPYMNYVNVDTVSQIDHYQTGTFHTCSTTTPCIQLHNGAKLWFNSVDFGTGDTTNVITFYADPDGVYSQTTTGPGKSVCFGLYYTGRLATRGTLASGSVHGVTVVGPVPSTDPPWFSWD